MVDLIKRDGTPYRIAPDALLKLKTDYPHIDVEGEIRKAANWLEANPRNRKKDVWRFLINWLNRARPGAVPVTPETSRHYAVLAERNKAPEAPYVPPPPEVTRAHLDSLKGLLGMRRA